MKCLKQLTTLYGDQVLILKHLAEFLGKTDRDTAAHLSEDDKDAEVWIFSLHNADYGFIFSVHTEDEKVVDIQARDREWILQHLRFDEYVEPPGFVREAVEERVEFAEDPDALATLEDNCLMCSKEYKVQVTPKIDLLIDGWYAQRVIQEYCPECDRSLTQKKTFNPPRQYETGSPYEFSSEEADITEYTWRHARR
ncbi:hypothetical protein SAMN05443574_103298 [Haloarcula vallismortis]|uniref:Uncharacterized protein n=2 Tax=Haloarcula vallismortis TaxID=28442 RepID=M0JUD4_HALVA|nr:hypothetical protein C437_01590 [Haloarcula vallismortis ATCC 29715]SDW44991.1 hypothetical protein SAMN05443574_103298 [Haloarcula vallismortis]